MPAFDLALKHGADGFEFDVRCTLDRHMIICHDPKLNRLTVRRKTLRQLRVSCSSADEHAPSLDDVLDRYKESFLNIEIKVRGIEGMVARSMRRVRPKQYFISSFFPNVVRKLHQAEPELVLGALAQTRWQLRRWPRLPVQYVVPHYRLLSEGLVEKIHASGKKAITWTVNDSEEMLRAAKMGVDGIISDDTKMLVRTLADR